MASFVTTGRDLSMRPLVCLLVACLATPGVGSFAAAQSIPEVGAPKVSSLTPRGGPFGIYKGMTRAELQRTGKLVVVDTGTFRLSSVPSPHAAFESYLVLFTEKLGVCRVVAIGTDITTNDFGTQVRAKFGDITEALDAKYGQHREADFLRSGSLWKESQYWMMGLLKKDRTLAAYWEASAAKPLPDGIEAIILEALATNSSTAFLRLVYDFDTVDACVAEIKKKKNSVF